MPGNRKAAEKVILDLIENLMPGSPNTQFYKEYFASMNDKEFEDYINKLDTGEIELRIQAPNQWKWRLSLERNFSIAKKLGHEFYERLWIKDPETGQEYLTPLKYLVVDMPLRRQAQLLTKKISIPENNNTVDNLTGQPTGKSKGSKISYPEVQIMAAQGNEAPMIEFLKYRGGDLRGFNAMNNAIASTGGVSLKALDQLGTKVKSTQTLKNLLTGMHLSSTL